MSTVARGGARSGGERARSGRWRQALVIATHAIAACVVVRALVEPFVLSTSGAGYEHDWGGPTLLGVLAVHMGPGALALLVLARRWRRLAPGRHTRRRPGVGSWSARRVLSGGGGSATGR